MIKQPVYFYISLVLLAVAAWFGGDRLLFLKSAQHVTGTVSYITSINSSCGRRYTRHSCTKFSAVVGYSPAGQSQAYSIILPAGRARGDSQPLSLATLHPGGRVAIVCNPKHPAEAYEDSLSGVWMTPIYIMFFQVCFLLTGLTEPRSRRW
jgi:hypothetical protein